MVRTTAQHENEGHSEKAEQGDDLDTRKEKFCLPVVVYRTDIEDNDDNEDNGDPYCRLL